MEYAYHTIERNASTATKVKGSRFIGYAAGVESRAEAESFIQRIQKKHHDATHHCSAYRIGVGNTSRFRTNDDGEPSGTAGKPILEAVTDDDLVAVLLIGKIRLQQHPHVTGVIPFDSRAIFPFVQAARFFYRFIDKKTPQERRQNNDTIHIL